MLWTQSEPLAGLHFVFSINSTGCQFLHTAPFNIYIFRVLPQTIERWRSAAILLAQHHYTSCFVAGEGDERPSVHPSICPPIRPSAPQSDDCDPPPKHFWGEPWFFVLLNYDNGVSCSYGIILHVICNVSALCFTRFNGTLSIACTN